MVTLSDAAGSETPTKGEKVTGKKKKEGKVEDTEVQEEEEVLSPALLLLRKRTAARLSMFMPYRLKSMKSCSR